MKIPKKIVLGGKSIEIRISQSESHREKTTGRCYFDRCLIVLDDMKSTGVSRQAIEETLVHEVVHFCNAMLGRYGECDSEQYVTPLSEILYQFIKQVKD